MADPFSRVVDELYLPGCLGEDVLSASVRGTRNQINQAQCGRAIGKVPADTFV
jgi:hypothetical protein